jgi:ArsR family transcriptional regulator
VCVLSSIAVGSVQERLKRRYGEVCGEGGLEKYISDLKKLAEEIGEESCFNARARFFKALSDPTRLKIIKLLAKKEMCVCEIMAALNLTQPNASHHLNLLEREGIVRKRREGKWIIYKLSTPKILQLLESATN